MQIDPSQQIQMRKMDGSGGSGGMRDIMQSLPQDERSAFREKLSSLSSEDRQSFKADMAAMDKASLASQDLSKALFDLLATYEKPQATTSSLVNVYA
jgi:hypothetical protein